MADYACLQSNHKVYRSYKICWKHCKGMQCALPGLLSLRISFLYGNEMNCTQHERLWKTFVIPIMIKIELANWHFLPPSLRFPSVNCIKLSCCEVILEAVQKCNKLLMILSNCFIRKVSSSWLHVTNVTMFMVPVWRLIQSKIGSLLQKSI